MSSDTTTVSPFEHADRGDADYFQSVEMDILENSREEDGYSLLAMSAMYGELSCCQVIYRRCPHLLYQRNNDGNTPLHLAAYNGRNEVIKFLLTARATLEQEEKGINIGGGGVVETILIDEELLMMVGDGNNTALHFAAFPGHLESAKFLLEVDRNKKLLGMVTTYKSTALHFAVQYHHLQMVELLVEADPDFEYAADNGGQTPLFMAWKEALPGDQKQVKIRDFLIQRQPSQCAVRTGLNGWTILHHAACDGDLSAIVEIIHTNPSCSVLVSNEGENFLHLATRFEHENIVKYVLGLVNISDNILNGQDMNDDTPLHVATRKGSAIIVLSLLSDHRVNRFIKNTRGNNALAEASSIVLEKLIEDKYPIKCAIQGDLEFFREIQEDVLRKCTDEYGESVLSTAVKEGHLNCCELISERCPELLLKTNKKGFSALHTAASNGKDDIVRFLLGARGKIVDYELLILVSRDNQCTALHFAAEGGHFESAKLLIEADPSNKLLEMVNLLQETALHVAVKKHHLEIVQLIVDAHPNFVYSNDNVGYTPLLIALQEASSGDQRAVDIRLFLIQKQTSQCKIRTGGNGWTLLQTATSKADLSAIEEIIQFCPDSLALVDKDGQNFLHIAVSFKHEHVVNYILGLPDVSDSVLNGKDKHGETPLHIATKTGSVSIALSLLYDHRVRKMIPNNNGKNALDAIRFDYNKRKAGVLGLVGEGDEKELKDQSDFDLLVGALIATVSFTAGITVPGGFNSDGQSRGTAILHKKVTFVVFVAFNTIALVLSLFAVFTQFCMKRLVDDKEISLQRKVATICSIGAIFAMVVAFIMGSIAVLSTSLLLVLIVCGICSIFFVCAFYSLWRMRRQQRQRRAGLIANNTVT